MQFLCFIQLINSLITLMVCFPSAVWFGSASHARTLETAVPVLSLGPGKYDLSSIRGVPDQLFWYLNRFFSESRNITELNRPARVKTHHKFVCQLLRRNSAETNGPFRLNIHTAAQKHRSWTKEKSDRTFSRDQTHPELGTGRGHSLPGCSGVTALRTAEAEIYGGEQMVIL